MSFIVIGGLVIAGVSAANRYKVGKQQEAELEMQAEQEKQAAKSRELERRQRLNEVLSHNIVSMSGQSGEGTPQSIALSNAKQASLSEGAESLSDRLRVAQLRRQAKAAATQGKMQAGSTLLKAGFSAYTGGQ